MPLPPNVYDAEPIPEAARAEVERLAAAGDYDAARAAFVARQPMGRIAEAEEVADLAVYLAGATYTTGQACCVDGGWTL